MELRPERGLLVADHRLESLVQAQLLARLLGEVHDLDGDLVGEFALHARRRTASDAVRLEERGHEVAHRAGLRQLDGHQRDHQHHQNDWVCLLREHVYDLFAA